LNFEFASKDKIMQPPNHSYERQSVWRIRKRLFYMMWMLYVSPYGTIIGNNEFTKAKAYLNTHCSRTFVHEQSSNNMMTNTVRKSR